MQESTLDGHWESMGPDVLKGLEGKCLMDTFAIFYLYPVSFLIYSDDHERAEGELMRTMVISAQIIIGFP